MEKEKLFPIYINPNLCVLCQRCIDFYISLNNSSCGSNSEHAPMVTSHCIPLLSIVHLTLKFLGKNNGY
ncbi:hypothetical protein ES703_83541 [subsurface metagenome]